MGAPETRRGPLSWRVLRRGSRLRTVVQQRKTQTRLARSWATHSPQWSSAQHCSCLDCCSPRHWLATLQNIATMHKHAVPPRIGSSRCARQAVRTETRNAVRVHLTGVPQPRAGTRPTLNPGDVLCVYSARRRLLRSLCRLYTFHGHLASGGGDGSLEALVCAAKSAWLRGWTRCGRNGGRARGQCTHGHAQAGSGWAVQTGTVAGSAGARYVLAHVGRYLIFLGLAAMTRYTPSSDPQRPVLSSHRKAGCVQPAVR